MLDDWNPLSDDDTIDERAHYGLVLLRFAPAVVFLVHGVGRFGVGPYAMSMGQFAGFLGSLGVPAAAAMAWVVTLLEVAGGVALLAGAFTRIAASLLAVDMFVAMVLVHLPNGFPAGDGGYEFTFVLTFAMAALALIGAGDYSVDARFFEEEPTPRALWERVAGG